jgi:hypothetical protein
MPEASTAYPVPAQARSPKHLFHFIIRYEGEGLVDDNIVKAMKVYNQMYQGEQKASAAAATASNVVSSPSLSSTSSSATPPPPPPPEERSTVKAKEEKKEGETKGTKPEQEKKP